MNEEYVPQGKGISLLRETYDWIESGLTAVLCVILLFTFAGRIVGVSGASMQPALRDRDRLISTRLYGGLKAGDIVVAAQPNDRDEPLIKRVIATGGQTVYIDLETGVVYVDGKALVEPYIRDPILPGSRCDTEFPQVVPPGHVFLMGDNRNDSWDSRSSGVGMVDERYVLGKVVFRILPLERMGAPDAMPDTTE